jgi:hypothetical protein
MTTLTIAEAARRCGVARRTLQRAIRAGRLTLTPDHRVALDAVQQAGYVPATAPQGHASATPQGHDAATDRGGVLVTPQEMTQALAQVLIPLVERLDRLLVYLDALCQRLEQLAVTTTPRRHDAGTRRSSTAATNRRDTTPAATPRTPLNVDVAYRRMRVLQDEGLSLTQIATQLDREGFRTKQGRPWHKSTVSYVLRTHGR